MTYEKAELLVEKLLQADRDWYLTADGGDRPIITDDADGRKVVSKLPKKKCPIRQRTKRRCGVGCFTCRRKK